MPNTFPYLGSWGGSDETDYRSILHEYDDGTWREYRKSTFKHRVITVPFTGVNKTKRDALEAFYVANRFLTVTLWFWPEATAIGTGVSHNAVIRGALTITNQSSCRYDCSFTFKLLD